MSDAAWEAEHSVETKADPAFVWAHMSDVKNWDDPPAQFALYGPFACGGRGTTQMPGQPARHWHLRDVRPKECYTIEFPLDGASLWFEWRFSGLMPDAGTRLTQHISLKGEHASTFVADIQAAFAPGLAAGMNRIAAAIDEAFAVARDR